MKNLVPLWFDYNDLWDLIYSSRHKFSKYDCLIPIPRAGNLVADIITNLTGLQRGNGKNPLIVDDDVGTGKTITKWKNDFPNVDTFVTLVVEGLEHLLTFYTRKVSKVEWIFTAWKLDSVALTPFKVAYDFDDCLYPKEDTFEVDVTKHLILPKGRFDIISSRWGSDIQSITDWVVFHKLDVGKIILNENRQDEIQFKTKACRNYDLMVESSFEVSMSLPITTICVENQRMIRR